MKNLSMWYWAEDERKEGGDGAQYTFGTAAWWLQFLQHTGNTAAHPTKASRSLRSLSYSSHDHL